jgi:serine phosphatase RsbU (regulator of sigma subunit)
LVAEHGVTRALGQCLTLADAVPQILQAIGESVGWDVVIYWSVDQNANVLRWTERWHAPTVNVSGLDRVSRQMTFSRGEGLPGRVWASDKPDWAIHDATESLCPRTIAAVDAGLPQAWGFPIRNGRESIGVIEFFSRTFRRIDEHVLAMMDSVGCQLTQFIERNQAEKALFDRERELGLARGIQQRRFPKGPPLLAGFDIGGASRPAQETGGDFFDFLSMSNGTLGLAIGDASGHGIAAALLMAETRAFIRALARTDPDVGRILTYASQELAVDVHGDDFVTLFLGRLDPRTRSLIYSNAGHWPGYLLDCNGAVRTVLQSTGIPLGIDHASTIPSIAVDLQPGDLLLLLTDGITEAFSPEGPPYGAARALTCVRAHRGRTSSEIVETLLDEVRAYSGDRQIDDMTAVVLKVSQV